MPPTKREWRGDEGDGRETEKRNKNIRFDVARDKVGNLRIERDI